MGGVLRGGIVSQLVVHIVRIGADERNPRSRPKRQNSVVLQQRHPFAGGLGGYGNVLCAADAIGRIFRKVRVVKKARLELAYQHTLDSTVQHVHGHTAGLHGFLQEGIAVGSKVYVHASVEGHLAGFLPVFGHVVTGVDAVNALEVAHHESLEVPAVLQHAGEEFLVAGGGNAVDGVVAGHDAEGAILNGRPESGQHVFFQVPEADVRGAAVVTALGNAVGHKVLESGDDALGRGAAHHGRCHLRGKVNVFSVGFFHAGPAGFAGEVYHRAVANGAALGHEF